MTSQSAAAGCLDSPVSASNHPTPVLDPAEVDDHIHLGRTVFHGVRRHEALGRGGVIAVGKADDGTHRQAAPQMLRRLRHIGCGNAHGGAAVVQTVVADGPDFLPGGRLGQDRMVAFS